MTGPGFRSEEKKAPPTEVIIPRLSRKEVQRRAETGYDKAVAAILTPQLKQLRADYTALRSDIISAIKDTHQSLPRDISEDERLAAYQSAIDGATENFKTNNPTSPLTIFLNRGNDAFSSFDYSLKGPNINIRLVLQTAAAEDDLKKPFRDVKQAVVSALIDASKPLKTGEYHDFFVTIPGVDAGMLKTFVDNLTIRLATSTNTVVAPEHLPIAVRYNEELGTPRLAFNYVGPYLANKADL